MYCYEPSFDQFYILVLPEVIRKPEGSLKAAGNLKVYLMFSSSIEKDYWSKM